jgi:hypothetical protein
MFLRMLCTAVALLFAILAFCGFGPMPSVWGRVSFGLGLLLVAFLIWRSSRFIVGDFSAPHHGRICSPPCRSWQSENQRMSAEG